MSTTYSDICDKFVKAVSEELHAGLGANKSAQDIEHLIGLHLKICLLEHTIRRRDKALQDTHELRKQQIRALEDEQDRLVDTIDQLHDRISQHEHSLDAKDDEIEQLQDDIEESRKRKLSA